MGLRLSLATANASSVKFGQGPRRLVCHTSAGTHLEACLDRR